MSSSLPREVVEAMDRLRQVGNARHADGQAIFVDFDRAEIDDGVTAAHEADFNMLPWFELDLSRSSVTDEGFHFLRSAMGLSGIEMSGRSAVDGSGFAHLARLPNLTRLNLDNGRITSDGMAGIGMLTHLRFLSLRFNYVRDEGLQHLEGLTSLQHLALENSLISDTGLSSLEGMIQLRRLFLEKADFTDDGLAHLSKMQELRWLSVAQNSIDGTGFAALPALPELENLVISKTSFSDESVDRILHFPRLKKIDVSDTEITMRGIQQLKGQYPDSDIIPRMPAGTRAKDQVFGSLVWAGQESHWNTEVEIEALGRHYVRWRMSCDHFEEDGDPVEEDTSEYHQPLFEMQVNDPDGSGPSRAQRKSWLLLKQHEQRICRDMLRGIWEYAKDDDAFGEFFGDEREAALRRPVVEALNSPDGLRELLGLGMVIMQRREKDGFAYMTFDFGCSWDEEHGVCVLMHKNRVVEVGELGGMFDFDHSAFHPGEGEPL